MSLAWPLGLGLLMILTAAGLYILPAGFGPDAGTWRRLSWVERQRETLAQAELGAVSVEAWMASRLGLSLVAGVVAWLYFDVPVLPPIAALMAFHIAGLLLERRRRRLEAVRQQALLDAVRYGAAVMSRAGNALQMVRSLSESGPVASREIFAAVLARAERSNDPLPVALEAERQRLSDPLFDDFALAVNMNATHGGKLVPALEELVDDWEHRLALRQDARALRAGQEASVRILALAPFGFLGVLQLISPDLLKPLRSVTGEVLLALIVASMVYGYRVLQRISSPRRTARLRVAGGA